MIRARRLFSINGLFVRFTVDVVLLLLLLVVSWPIGDGEAVDDGDVGAKFTAELVLLAFNDDSICAPFQQNKNKKMKRYFDGCSRWSFVHATANYVMSADFGILLISITCCNYLIIFCEILIFLRCHFSFPKRKYNVVWHQPNHSRIKQTHGTTHIQFPHEK